MSQKNRMTEKYWTLSWLGGCWHDNHRLSCWRTRAWCHYSKCCRFYWLVLFRKNNSIHENSSWEKHDPVEIFFQISKKTELTQQSDRRDPWDAPWASKEGYSLGQRWWLLEAALDYRAAFRKLTFHHRPNLHHKHIQSFQSQGYVFVRKTVVVSNTKIDLNS